MTKDERWLLEEKYGGKKTPEFEADAERLRRSEPLGYVIGWQPFLGLKIYLDSRPLIPRPETEWWTEQLLQGELAKQKMGIELGLAARSVPIFCFASEPQLRFLDLCAGSGAIGCAALARLHTRRHDDASNAQVYFGEIDPAHKATILKNIRENNLDESRAHIYIGDLFEPFNNMPAEGGSAFGGKFDIIAANPPYIPADRVLPPSVADYEPARALYAGADGLDLIRRIAKELPQHLADKGVAWIECDSAHAAAACALFATEGLSAELHNDQYGVPRIIVVTLTGLFS